MTAHAILLSVNFAKIVGIAPILNSRENNTSVIP